MPLRKSLGGFGCVTIIGGSAGILAVMSYLAFLWFGYGPAPEASDARSLWRLIALRAWMPEVITLSSLVLRFLVSAQSTVCTSMIAALVLERRFIRRSQVTRLSVTRVMNNGPWELIGLVRTSVTFSWLLYPEIGLLVLLALVTLALQFSSTILLSDLQQFTIAGDVNPTQVSSLIQTESNNLSFLPSYQMDHSAVYPAFGEVFSDSSADPDVLGLSDTGVQRRGLLPLTGSGNRTATRKFSGNTLVFNSRVVCVPPDIDATYQIGHTSRGSIFGNMVGALNYSSSLEAARPAAVTPPGPVGSTTAGFYCGIPSGSGSKSFKTSFCFVGGIGWTYPSKVAISAQVPVWDTSEPPWAENQTMYLVFSSNLDESGWSSISTGHEFTDGTVEEEWRSFEVLPDKFIKASLCFAAYSFERPFVNMVARGIPKEPEVILDLVRGQYHDTTKVQEYLGVTRPTRSTGERGIFDMDISPSRSLSTANNTIGNAATLSYMNQIIVWQLTNSRTPNQTFLTCWTCASGGTSVHPAYTALFEDILISTNRAANALLSFINVLAFTAYYDSVASFSQAEKVDIATASVVLTPGPCRGKGCPGYISVTMLLVVHLVYVGAVTVLYVRHIRYSRYGNIWHTISQIVSGELRETFDQANEEDDKTVESDLKSQGLNNIVRLNKTVHDKVEVCNVSAY